MNARFHSDRTGTDREIAMDTTHQSLSLSIQRLREAINDYLGTLTTHNTTTDRQNDPSDDSDVSDDASKRLRTQ